MRLERRKAVGAQRSLKSTSTQAALHEKKNLTREAAELLLDKLGTDLSSLEQEMYKLITYCAERPQITAQDVQAMCYTHKPVSVWNLAGDRLAHAAGEYRHYL